MKHKFPTLQLLLSITLFLLSCALFVFLYLKIKNNNEISQQLLTQWQTEADKRNDMSSLNRSVQAIASENSLLQTHFIQSSDVVPFLDMIEQLAPEAGAKAAVADVSTDKTKLVVEVKASGSFQSLYKFLTLLENSPYEIEFDSLDIQKPQTTDASAKTVQSSIWSADFTLRLLSFIP